MRIDMCIDRSIDMYGGMCIDMCIERAVHLAVREDDDRDGKVISSAGKSTLCHNDVVMACIVMARHAAS